MFWGLIMEPQRRYTQQVKKSFHISMAALDVSTSSDEPAQVMCGFEGRNYLLCTLKKPDLLQCPLDLSFDIGSEVSFAANGKCHVHLTGYLSEDLDLPDPEEPEAEEEEEQEINNATVKSKKRSKKNLENGPPNKKLKSTKVSSSQNEDQTSDSDDSDFETDVKTLLEKSLDDSDDDSDAVIDENIEEDEEDEDEDEVDEEEEDSSLSEGESEGDKNENISKSKMNGVPKKQEQESRKQKKDKKKEKLIEPNKKSSQSEQKNEVKTPNKENPVFRKKVVLQGGVVIEDIKEGQGAPAKVGKIVNVYYEGRLKKNNKVFDSANKGAGFSFRLGAGDVIRGWDVGVLGMKPGGKRRILCPAPMAYGQKGSPPAIPPNATLIFEVELRRCH